MGMEQDRQMLLRAGLSEQADALRITSFTNNPVQFLMRLDGIRKSAQSGRFDAVAEIASAFESALQRVERGAGAHAVVENYMEILEEAIGCNQMPPQLAQQLLASVAVRLHG
jgi:hypothetical protein